MAALRIFLALMCDVIMLTIKYLPFGWSDGKIAFEV